MTDAERKANNAASAKKSRQIKQQAEAMSDKQSRRNENGQIKSKYYEVKILRYFETQLRK